MDPQPADPAPHPVTGVPFGSPVPPGTGEPGDLATARTPKARSATDVSRLVGSSRDLDVVSVRSSVCRACPRLVGWREEVATTGRRASFADQPYWERPGPGFGLSSVIRLVPEIPVDDRVG